MSDNTNAENIPDVTPEPDNTPAEPQGTPEIDWKAEARKWETRAKADHDLAAKWRDYETSQKSEHEKLADELARKDAEASQAKAELLRYKIASEKGITGEATKLLKGTTQEELESEANLLLSLIANQSKPKTPMPDENQGKPTPEAVGQITDAKQLDTMTAAEIVAARKSGRLDELMGKR